MTVVHIIEVSAIVFNNGHVPVANASTLYNAYASAMYLLNNIIYNSKTGVPSHFINSPNRLNGHQTLKE